ncbi:MAG: molybdenum cofactor guanylyltransferase [Acidobacteriota bacterium]
MGDQNNASSYTTHRSSNIAEAVERPVGVVLAGGRSRRMGRDKAVLMVDGETLAGRATRLLGAVCDEVVVADRGRGVVPGQRSLDDGPGAGPAAGILGAAAACPGRPLLVLACDMPRVSLDVLHALDRTVKGEAVVPRHRDELGDISIEPLCALYRLRALEVLRARVERGELAMMGLIDQLEVSFLDVDDASIFTNLNRPTDLDDALL